MSASNANQDMNGIEIGWEDIQMEWRRQAELQRRQMSYIMCWTDGRQQQVIENAVMTLDPLSITLFDDHSAFRIGAYLAMETFPATKLSLTVRTKKMTLDGAQAFVHGLKRSQVTKLELGLEGEGSRRPHDDATSHGPNVWKIIVQGALDAVPDLDLRNELDNSLADRIGSQLVGNTSLRNLRLRLYKSSMTEYGAQRLADGIRQAHIQKLEITFYKTFGLASCKASEIIGVQAVHANVRELFLSYDLENHEARALGEALVGNTSLKSLSFSIAGYLTEESAVVLAYGLCQSSIALLDMWGTDGHHTSRDAENVIYKVGIQHSQTIRHLRLGSCLSLNDTASFVNCFVRLHSLEIYQVDEDRNKESLFNNLRGASQLRSLKVGHGCTARDLIYLSTVLPNLSSLTHLTVKGNLTCDEGIDYVNERPQQHGEGEDFFFDNEDFFFDDEDQAAPLEYSELTSRNIQGFAAEALMGAVATHPALIHLDLSGSSDIGLLGLSAIGNRLQFAQLRELHLGSLPDEFAPAHSVQYGDDDDVQAARTRAFQCLVDGVRSNDHLLVLTLDGNDVPATVFEKIDFQLQVNMLRPYLSDAESACGVWCQILAKYQESASVIYHLLREQPMLVGTQ